MTASEPDGRPRFDALGLVVSDLAAAVSFYELLGLEFVDEVGSGEHLGAEAHGGFRLMLDSEAVIGRFDPSWSAPAAGPGRMRLAVDCGEPGSVDRVHAAVVGAGHRSHAEPFDAFWGQRYASILDPDGNIVDLYAALRPPAGSD